MATNNLGKVSVTPGGAWNSSATYSKLTCVSNNGSAYMSTQNVTAGIEPGTTAGNSYWMLLCTGVVDISLTGSEGNIDTYTIYYANGSTGSFTVSNGLDGVSPTASINKSGSTATITITDASGTTTANIEDGVSPAFGAPTASTTTVGPDESASVMVGASGPDTAKVFNFDFFIPQGEKGETGTGLTILGYYDTIADLEAAVTNPEPGDAYGVGAAEPYDIYIWSGNELEWKNNGNIQGPTGPSGTITVGSTITGAAGSAAVVENVGTETAAVFNFTIPQGNVGETGPQGPQGAKGDPGAAGGFGTPTATATGLSTGEPPTVSVVASGPDAAKVFTFAFGIPAGATGPQGANGPNIISTSTATAMNGLLKGNGSSIEVATGGIDYQSPIDVTGILLGTGSGVVSLATSMTDYVGIFGNAGFHNSIFTGRNLGTSVTAAQWAAIAAGTFDDMFIGDYWVINSIIWRIAAFNYYYGSGNPQMLTPHVVMTPDQILYVDNMNDTATTADGYVGSKMFISGLDAAKATINAAFGASHILTYSLSLDTVVTDGYPSARAWTDVTVTLMSEQAVYGHRVYEAITSGTNVPNISDSDKGQYPLFSLAPEFIVSKNAAGTSRVGFWLRNVATSANFSFVGAGGNPGQFAANSTNYGVRPCFCICA